MASSTVRENPATAAKRQISQNEEDSDSGSVYIISVLSHNKFYESPPQANKVIKSFLL